VEPALYDTTYRVEDTHWWFSGRRAIVLDALRREMDAKNCDARVLDLGCGTGRNLVELQALARPVGLDLEGRALAWSRKRGLQRLVQGGAEQLPFQAGSFDTVTALDLLEHIQDDTAGAREVHRVLRPGGKFLVFVPAYRWLWGPQDDVSHHLRRYNPSTLATVLSQAGFEVRRLSHANLLLFPLILAGRWFLRITRKRVDTENTLHPSWSNGILKQIFSLERYLLRALNLPMGVSLLCIAVKQPLHESEAASAAR
jgi:SAM-dependent methyltransferase